MWPHQTGRNQHGPGPARTAPASRYQELVPVLRARFDAIGPQEGDSYGHSDEQEALAALAATLAQFDPRAGAYVEPWLVEPGPVQVREVTRSRPANCCHSRGDGKLVRDMFSRQDRHALFNSRDDDIDATVVRVVK